MRLFLRDFFMSMYTTAQLLAANEQKFKFDPLFLRLFFRESYPFTTEKVYLSQIPGLVNMALYVSPIVSGEVIRIWYAITAMPPTPSSCIRIISSGLFSGSVIAQAGAIWASGRKKPVPFPARLKRHGKSLPRMTAAALTLSENARLP